MGRAGGSPGVGSGGHPRGPARRRGLRGAQLCRRQQPGAAGPGRLGRLRGSAAREFSLAPGQGRGAAGRARDGGFTRQLAPWRRAETAGPCPDGGVAPTAQARGGKMSPYLPEQGASQSPPWRTP